MYSSSFIPLLIPFTLGLIGILQGGINRQVANLVGVAHATLISNLLTVAICVLFYLYVKSFPSHLPEFFRVKSSMTTYRWWFIFPAIFGFMIVAGLPYAISQVGAVKVTIVLIGAQIMAGVVWDIFVEKRPLNTTKTLGLILAFASVILTTLPSR